MIAYVHCLPADPMVGCFGRSKWQPSCNDEEEEEELIPLYSSKMGNAHTKLPGRLKKKLLSKDDNSFWPSKISSCSSAILVISYCVVIIEEINK